MRNPSRRTIKKLMRPKNGHCPGWGSRNSDYFLFNQVGARLWIMSKGKICNRLPKGFERYLTAAQKAHLVKMHKEGVSLTYWHENIDKAFINQLNS